MTERTYQGFPLDDFQERSIDAIERGENVIVAAPTGCGKTLVAEYAIERALTHGERVVYTAPIKALSNQKFRDFGARYGARIGIMTGDVTINPTADAMIMTTEIFRNTIFDNPAKLAGIRYVILDEAHYLDDPERGTVWEESIIFAPPQIRFIMLSATISNLDQFASWVRKIREGGLTVVLEERRPVPLRFFVFTGEATIDIDDASGKRFVAKREDGRGPAGGRVKPPAPGAFGPGGRGRHGGPSAVEVEEVPAERRSGRDGYGGRSGRTGRGRDDGGGGRGGRGGRRGLSPMQRSFRLIDTIAERDHLPCIFFLFSRVLCEQMAFHCADKELLDLEEKHRITEIWDGLVVEFQLQKSDAAARLGKIVKRGIAFHHAGMLPTLKEVIERLFTTGLVKLLFATETFALGVNMPARAVAFETLKKFDGVKRDYMRTREFMQMAGRAGRRGKDEEGFVYAGVDPEEERPPEVRRVMEGTAEPVESQFNLSYATLLTLWAHLGDGIYTACERSFIHFRSRGRATPFHDMIAQVKRRIRLLEDEGYIRGRALTAKGKYASLIYGFEVQTAELHDGGFLASLDAHQLACLCVSLVYEAKREGWSVPLARHLLEPLRRTSRDRIGAFRAREQSYRITQETKLPEWTLARATWEWTHGAPFESLSEWAEVSPGDLVRWFRLGIQVLRQLAKPLRFMPEDSTRFQETIRESMKLMKRGEVDAERALRQAIRHEAGPAAEARIPHEADIAEEAPEGEVTLEHVAHEEEAGTHALDADAEAGAAGHERGGPSARHDHDDERDEDDDERDGRARDDDDDERGDGDDERSNREDERVEDHEDALEDARADAALDRSEGRDRSGRPARRSEAHDPEAEGVDVEEYVEEEEEDTASADSPPGRAAAPHGRHDADDSFDAGIFDPSESRERADGRAGEPPTGRAPAGKAPAGRAPARTDDERPRRGAERVDAARSDDEDEDEAPAPGRGAPPAASAPGSVRPRPIDFGWLPASEMDEHDLPPTRSAGAPPPRAGEPAGRGEERPGRGGQRGAGSGGERGDEGTGQGGRSERGGERGGERTGRGERGDRERDRGGERGGGLERGGGGHAGSERAGGRGGSERAGGRGGESPAGEGRGPREGWSQAPPSSARRGAGRADAGREEDPSRPESIRGGAPPAKGPIAGKMRIIDGGARRGASGPEGGSGGGAAKGSRSGRGKRGGRKGGGRRR